MLTLNLNRAYSYFDGTTQEQYREGQQRNQIDQYNQALLVNKPLGKTFPNLILKLRPYI